MGKEIRMEKREINLFSIFLQFLQELKNDVKIGTYFWFYDFRDHKNKLRIIELALLCAEWPYNFIWWAEENKIIFAEKTDLIE